MRLGVAWTPGQNAQYRAFQPMRAMARRGHTIVWPPDESGELHLPRLLTCDVVHVFRRSEQDTRQVVRELARGGVPFTFDNDDDLTAVPERPGRGVDRRSHFAATVRMARAARIFTTTTDVLAAKYRLAGVKRIEVIGNYLVPEAVRPRLPHDGIVVGWVAGKEHRIDTDRLRIAETLRRLVAKHPDVRVECIGVDLALPERYRHDVHVDFDALPGRIGDFDIGLAPLTDISFNRARSDIKLKEYAASGVPWLASAVGPYVGLGEEHGGLLVSDARWFDALDRLVTDHSERERLGRNALAWAQTQTMAAAADQWEAVFKEAAGGGGGRRVATTSTGRVIAVRPRRRRRVREGSGGTPGA